MLLIMKKGTACWTLGAGRVEGEGELEDIIVSTPKQLVEQFNNKAKTRTFPPLFSKLLAHGHRKLIRHRKQD
jgi:hypothetical protein